jgi:fatty-acyl-CoA synthase
MGLWERIGRELTFISRLQRLLKRIKPVDPKSSNLVPDDFEKAVDQWPDNIAVVFDERQVTYRELDAMANRYAHWIKGRGLKKGDTVALVMPNRIEYLAIWMGFLKVGVSSALINNNLTGQALAHSLAISGASQIVADYTTYEAVEACRNVMEKVPMIWVLGLRTDDETSDRRGLDAAVKGASTVRPDRTNARYGIHASDTALFIYTSGTTGLPKAARITHARAQMYMLALAGGTGATDKDKIYCVLPLYHSTGGLCAVGTAFMNGGTLVLRQKFSATHFWPDVAKHGCTMFVYIGELCRYLVNQPPEELDHKHKLRLAFGNGLRPEVWKVFQHRFKIPEILEFYGSTEGNVSLFNFDGKPGAIGRIPSYLRGSFNIRLAKFDMDTEDVIRASNGLCVEAKPGEIGEALGEIKDDARHAYAGYADKAASEKKVLRGAFSKGDAWFRTGDLMKQDNDGYFYFVDRIGDTYRWKGENVSTTEVADQLAGAPGVKEATVYGVPVEGMEGKAGMASLVVGPDFNMETFAEHIDHDLAAYARPVFLRLQKDITTTGTFKYRKVDLVTEGFDPKNSKNPLYYRDPDKGYVKITPRNYMRLDAGSIRL